MDDGRFDDLTRTLARSGTRRASLRVLAGSALAGGLTWLGVGDVAAACKPAGKRCKRNKNCCCKKCRKRKNGKKKCRGNACLENGTVCFDPFASDPFDSDKCCSGFCRQNPLPAASTCCVPNDKKCVNASDCCTSAEHPAACVNDHCCRKEGGICGIPNDILNTPCCSGLVCDDDTRRCIKLGIGT